MQKLRWLGLVLLAVAVLVAAGCGDDDDDGGGGGGGGGGEASGEPVKVGASLPLTGEFAEPGKAAKQGYEVWEAMVNEQGGLIDGRPVEMVIKDDQSNQNTIVADYNALISRDQVDLLLGTFSSLLNLPASAVAERNRMLYVEPAGGAPELFDRGFKYLFFAQQATADKQGEVWANYIAELPEGERPKTAAYPTLDDPFAQPTSEGIEAILKPAGIETVYRETYTIDNPNLDGIANALKSRNPDLVVHGATFEDGVGMVRALRKADFTPKMLYQTTAPSLGDQYSGAIGKETTEGIFYGVSHSKEAADAGQPGVRREVPRDVRRHRGAGGRGRRVRDGAGTPGGGRRGGHDRARPSARARGLAAREHGRHDPRPAELGRAGAPGGRVPRRPVAERRPGDHPA